MPEVGPLVVAFVTTRRSARAFCLSLGSVAGLDAVVTRNERDFSASPIPILLPRSVRSILTIDSMDTQTYQPTRNGKWLNLRTIS
jgi:hypothetical protein